MNRKDVAREFAQDFVSGGFLVAIALAVAYAASPIVGGLIVGLPIRFAATWLMAARRKGPSYAERMAKGSIRGMAGNIVFSVALFFALVPLGFAAAFMLAIALCFGSIAVLKLTFRG